MLKLTHFSRNSLNKNYIGTPVLDKNKIVKKPQNVLVDLDIAY